MKKYRDGIIALLFVLGWTVVAAGAEPTAPLRTNVAPPLVGGGATIDLVVPLYKSRVVTVDVPTSRVSVGNPDVADFVVISPTQLYVLGKDIGNSNLLLWDSNSHLIGSINVEVQHDLEDLKRKLAQILPQDPIEVRSAQRAIVLSGRVSDAEAQSAAVRIAQTFLAQIQTAKKAQQFQQQQGNTQREDKAVGEIINLLQIGGSQQVMLEVKVAEMQRSELRRMNAQFNNFWNGGKVNLGGVNGGATLTPFLDQSGLMHPVFDSLSTKLVPSFGGSGNYPGSNPVSTTDFTRWGPQVDSFLPNALSIADKGLFGSFISGNLIFDLMLDAAKNKGLAKILAEPNLTTLTGQEAKFLSGGQIPIPIANALGAVSIDYKDYGVGLSFIPVVLSDGHINLKLNVSVSELVDTTSLGVSVSSTNSTFIIPSLTTRQASGTIELGDGQTMGLAGILNDSLRTAVNKFPVLGDVPILGALFRDQAYTKGDTELVILVTPHLAKPVDKKDVKLPTDSFVEPSDADFYLWGRIEGHAHSSDQH
jgi:pilus assembly protein CpaC